MFISSFCTTVGVQNGEMNMEMYQPSRLTLQPILGSGFRSCSKPKRAMKNGTRGGEGGAEVMSSLDDINYVKKYLL